MKNYRVIMDNWLFTKENQTAFATEDVPADNCRSIHLPHTWNAYDGQDGGNDYDRSVCWYQKRLSLPQIEETENLYLQFNAVNSVADVYLNGTHLGCHKGGYSAFRFDITQFAGEENILLSVKADNRDIAEVYPHTADFTFFGGIYRDVFVYSVHHTHFSLEECGAEGIYIDTELSEDYQTAEIRLATKVTNAQEGMQLKTVVWNAEGEAVKTVCEAWREELTFSLEQPILWQGVYNPYLYTFEISLLTADGMELDKRKIPFGIRSFYVDHEQGFFLNGKSYPLYGVSRHQDRENKGWAIGRTEHEEDMALIREIGASSVRLAHYQQDDYFYELCDKYGLVVWAEIPFISEMTKTKEASENLRSQMRELVLQNYNHSSICFWGLQNEATIQSGRKGEDPELVQMVRELHTLCKKLNPARLTTQACLGSDEADGELAGSSDVTSFNMYYGWYLGEAEELGPWLDERHKMCKRPIGLSEYGGDGSVRFHNDKPKANDYSEDYQAILHEKHAKILTERPYIWSYYVWNMFDFGSDRRDEGGAAGRNQKGLVTYDRKIKKDAFYLYKAYWSDEPFVHICGHTYINRTVKEREIKVYSNAREVTLFHNGKKVASLSGEKIFIFRIQMELGRNQLVAAAGGVTDELLLNGVTAYDKRYKLTELEGAAGIVNWFENVSEFQFVDGNYSINDRITDILEVPEAEEVLKSHLSGLTDWNFILTAKNFKLAKIVSKYIPEMSPEDAVRLNEALAAIKKIED